MNDLVSVVLPVRYVNYEWLRQSIESVLNQSYPNIQLIVVNDEATLPIDDLIVEYGIKKYIKNPKNMKLPYSLNRGFEVAEGKYMTWTSADNYMHPDMIKKLVEKLQSLPKNYGIVFASSYVVDEQGVVNQRLYDENKSYMDLFKKAGDTYNCITNNSFYWSTAGACFLYTKEIKDKYKYNESIHGAEDYDFWIRASSEFKAYFLQNEMLYYYRTHGAAISSTVKYCYTKMRVDVLTKELQKNKKNKNLRNALSFYKDRYYNEKAKPNFKIKKRLIRLLSTFIFNKDKRKAFRKKHV